MPSLARIAPDAVLERRAHLGQPHAVAQQVAQLAQLARRDGGLGQQLGAQQVGQRPGVDGVVLTRAEAIGVVRN